MDAEHSSAMELIEEEEGTVAAQEASDEFLDLRTVARHFGVWKAPSVPDFDAKIKQIKRTIGQAVDEASVLLACRLRGIEAAGRRKLQLVQDLATAIRLQCKKLGEHGYEQMRLAELSIPDLRQHGQLSRAASLEAKLRRIWAPLTGAYKQQLQKRVEAAEQRKKALLLSMENRYVQYRIQRQRTLQDEEYLLKNPDGPAAQLHIGMAPLTARGYSNDDARLGTQHVDNGPIER